jgi:hypothetical protein
MTSLRSALQAGIAATAVAAAAGAAHASAVLNFNYQTYYNTTYPDTDPPSLAPVTNVMMYQQTETGSSLTWAFTINPTGVGDVDYLVNPFPDPHPTQLAGLIGLVPDAGGGAPHIVLGMSTEAAVVTANEGWDAVFPNTSEQTVLDALELATSGEPFCANGQVSGCVDPPGGGVNEIFAFMQNDLVNIANPNTDLVAQGLEPAIVNGQFAVPGDFVLETFSNGVTVGGGSAGNLAVPVLAPVPEPGTWAMLMLGLFGVGALARGARKSTVQSA